MTEQETNRWGYTPEEIARFLGEAPPLDVGPRFVRMKGEPYVRKVSVSEFEDLFGITYLTHLRFPDEKTFRQVIRQCPWFSKYTQRGKERLWLGHWHAPELASGRVAHVSVRYIDEQLGYGLFAEEPMPAYTFLGFYTGNIKQWRMFQQNQNGYCFHYASGFWHRRIFMVDAFKGGNEMRFANHSEHPSAEALTLLNRSMIHIFLRTLRPLEYGEEITFSYGGDYWMRRDKLSR